ncbi:MAG: bifunctional 5,10-methylene-tetrahydrofolate dehydrogenase/5,10-methylene-tetrahydrofolate cyclohydrolase [Synergistaceae bacterium]|nr:bifunctional 5,10-methylene-tetrahydrofolate dehydrogenase/5,10-methylene-tetrahydrofolate cyclohydrolase [Synergistaceae bacterium]
MAELLKGAAVAAAMTEVSADEVRRLEANNIKPALAIVRVGENPGDIAYERNAGKKCAASGVAVRNVLLPADCEQTRMLDVIESLNADNSVHGVLIFRPLPEHIDDESIRAALSPMKDVDGITDASLARVFTGRNTVFAPCTARACLEILDYYGVSLEGKLVVVVGRSLVIGKPVAMLMVNRHATVTICHTRTKNLPSLCREAEILVAAAGHARMIGREYLSAGQTVIDVGINVTGDEICGDVSDKDACALAAAYTPVPGGVGTVTSAVLVSHVVSAAWNAYRATLKEATIRG